jgi:hypothetical protein
VDLSRNIIHFAMSFTKICLQTSLAIGGRAPLARRGRTRAHTIFN